MDLDSALLTKYVYAYKNFDSGFHSTTTNVQWETQGKHSWAKMNKHKHMPVMHSPVVEWIKKLQQLTEHIVSVYKSTSRKQQAKAREEK